MKANTYEDKQKAWVVFVPQIGTLGYRDHYFDQKWVADAFASANRGIVAPNVNGNQRAA